MCKRPLCLLILHVVRKDLVYPVCLLLLAVPAIPLFGQLPAGWTSLDIGGPSAAGSAQYNGISKTWIIRGDGAGIRDRTDQFQFVYKTLSGDGELAARVVSIDPPLTDWSMAGVMIRVMLTPGSPFLFMGLSASADTRDHRITLWGRTALDAVAEDETAGAMTASHWVKIKRAGNTFSGHFSLDGKEWTEWYSTTALGIPKDIYIGYAVTSDVNGELVTAVFDQGPVIAADPNPGNGATDVPQDGILSWVPGETAVRHDVYLGTSLADVQAASRADPRGVLVSEGQTATTYEPPGLLDFGTTYYWRIDEVNAPPDSTIFKGNVWSFTTEPFAYPIENVVASSNGISDDVSTPERTVDGSGLDAADQHSVDSEDMWLADAPEDKALHIQYQFDRVYKLHELLVWNYNVQFELMLGFGVKDVTIEYSEDGQEWVDLGDVELNQATATSTYTYNTTMDLPGVAARFVRLTVNSGWGPMGQFGLSEVRFLYIPAQAREPHPEDGATNVDPETILSWRAGRDASSHDVYLGTDADELDLVETTDGTSYDPGAMNLGVTYYWQVNAVQEAESWEGDLWSFATQEYLVVDDFESYTDDIDAGEAIFDTWLDGWVNETGSTVGHLQSPFAEKTIVRSGSQSMPLFYDNTDAAVSEADYELTADWTTNGIRSLSLYFHGDPDNTGQLYVKINETNVPYDGDADDITRSVWQPWNIDLSAVGNVSNVRSLTIGIEGAGATGVVYIDDIRLYPKEVEYVTPVEPDTANLVAYYAFDGNVNDGSGSGHHGTINGTPTYVAGVQGNAIDLNGSTDYVSTGKSASDLGIAGNSPRTVTVWVYTRSFANGGIYDVGARTEAQNFSLRTLDNVQNRWRIQYWGGDFDFTYDTAERWVHFAHVHDGTHTKIYADGVLIVNWEKTIDTADDNPFQIGLYGWPGNYFDGLIDELRLYNRALSAEEVLGAFGQTEPVYKPF